jgi:hypothetical protein
VTGSKSLHPYTLLVRKIGLSRPQKYAAFCAGGHLVSGPWAKELKLEVKPSLIRGVG